MLTLVARFDVQIDEDDILTKFGLEDHGPVQMLIDQRVKDYCRDGGYVPASPERALETSADSATEIGSGEVIWDTPYARYQYYGLLMTDENGRTWVREGEKKPIIHEDRPLKYDKGTNGNAGARWFDRMKADHGDDIVEEARNYVRRGGRST